MLSNNSKKFEDHVKAKYELYNSLFMSLPYDKVKNTGELLPIFHNACKVGFESGKNAREITTAFLNSYCREFNDQDKNDLLFRFIQYIERQIVLFDAIEDASFDRMNNLEGSGTISYLIDKNENDNLESNLKEHLNQFKLRLVFTAHPTQFYPGSVLGIITDLEHAIRENDVYEIKRLLSQLGKTPFFKKEKPTPYEEASRLTWYLENVFYYSFSEVYNQIKTSLFHSQDFDSELLKIGFWPGGDRDGNPFVNHTTTQQVASRLRTMVFKKYHQDLRKLKRKLTFERIEPKVIMLIQKMHDAEWSGDPGLSLDDFVNELKWIRKELLDHYSGMYVDEINDLLNKTYLFGYHFATLDIRQDSRVHGKTMRELISKWKEIGNSPFPENYENLDEKQKIEFISKLDESDPGITLDDKLCNEVLSTIRILPEIQIKNGEKSVCRYIISNNQSSLNVMELFFMLRTFAFVSDIKMDIIPLFETINDLKVCEKVMREMYSNENYMKHLKSRGSKQTIMLGFSDGTKDGGYLMANWSIYKAKEMLTKVSREFGIEVVFFDGRGGPPARGGGETHAFYASLGPTIASNEIELTIQGQTISSNFGTTTSSKFNIEQLISSALYNLSDGEINKLSEENRKTFDELALLGFEKYEELKKHPAFVPYLEEMSTLKFYPKANIGSRPSKRSSDQELRLSDLRAIPFVGAWSQLKQNVPGFFGVGSAIEQLNKEGRFTEVKQLYRESKFFRTLLDNCMMSLSKTFFELTRYMSEDEKFGEFWSIINQEFELTKELLLKLSGFKNLMENTPLRKASIDLRESIVLPLLTIQQNALMRLREEKDTLSAGEVEVLEKMVVRSLYGNINANRNSA